MEIFDVVTYDSQMILMQPCTLDAAACARGYAETYMLEESVVDPVRRTMEMKTRNITLKQLLEVQEVCVYREAGSNTSWTQMSQEFSCSILGTSLSGMGSMVAKAEQAIINRVQSNASKGAAILNEVVEGLMKTELKTRGDALNIIVPA